MSFAIAAGHDATADTAQEILKIGGNAFDAAIAAFMTAFVAEPCMVSGGGGAFANIRKADGTCQLFDFFCQTPRNKKSLEQIEFLPIEVNFGTATELFHIGKGAVGVPGSIAGIFSMHEHLGSIPMADLVQLPIQYAKEGVAVNNFQAEDMDLLKEILKHTEYGRSLFYKNENIAKRGDVIKMPHLADFLDQMAREGQEFFYKGEIAQKIVDDQQEGGHLIMEDFENYKVIIREPLSFEYREKKIFTNPLPSIGGTLIAHDLNALEKMKLAEFPMGRDYIIKLYEAFLASENLDRRPTALARSFQQLLASNKKHGSTTHFNIVDKWGNAVSLSSTIGEGSGYFVEGTDIQLNNMLGEAALLPDGFHSWLPDTRLSSMMAPTIVVNKNDRLEVVTGSGGASRIPSAITQVLHNLFDYKASVDDAVNRPRVHLGHGVFNIEPGFNAEISGNSIKETVKLWNEQSLFFGGVHTIACNGGALYASGDERRDGVIRVE
ncbi:MAG: gamma-glutamyltranspeptidase/glutathione hydrolase [Saprospiraceae bacterium]|jgi:gamma-glutamyltranspeptidase/glutathione hydrolase